MVFKPGCRNLGDGLQNAEQDGENGQGGKGERF